MTESVSVINFRKNLIKFLQNKGHSVCVIAHDNLRENEIRDLGADFYCVKQDNRGLNPFAILKYRKNLTKIIKKENPDAVFTFQLKPNTFGVKSAKKAGVKNIYSMVEGLGDVYIKTGLKWKLIRSVVDRLYKSAFKASKAVFFLNNDDKKVFIERKLVCEDKCTVISGIGVDLSYFAYKPIKNAKNFLMVARMLRTKGLYEYLECARLVKQKYPDAVFNYLGAEASEKLIDIKEYIDDGSINYLGVTKDVRPYIEDCTALVLPSYREGFPMSIMEAQSVGRMVITTNVVGCKDAIVDGYNGFLVEKGNSEELAKKIIWCIENKDEVIKMCQNARVHAQENFDKDIINSQIYGVINENLTPAIIE